METTIGFGADRNHKADINFGLPAARPIRQIAKEAGR